MTILILILITILMTCFYLMTVMIIMMTLIIIIIMTPSSNNQTIPLTTTTTAVQLFPLLPLPPQQLHPHLHHRRCTFINVCFVSNCNNTNRYKSKSHNDSCYRSSFLTVPSFITFYQTTKAAAIALPLPPPASSYTRPFIVINRLSIVVVVRLPWNLLMKSNNQIHHKPNRPSSFCFHNSWSFGTICTKSLHGNGLITYPLESVSSDSTRSISD
mmetsp:Transcript_41336/g.58173  ORF Transcript_41336/g.58173 Transcript_41336/m.58173 type:complete len:214 (+) Transcript_41336:174-815(+)